MKQFLIIGFGLLFFAAPVFSESMYVGEVVNITLRTGKGTDHKIIEMVKSGQKVEVVEPGTNWTRIRTTTGREGWVLTRLLTKKTPSGILYEKLKKEHEALLEKLKAPIEEIKKLETENKQLAEQLAEVEKTKSNIENEHNSLKEASTEVIQKKKEYQKSAARLAEMKGKYDELDIELGRIQRRQIFRWFLAGAAVLLVGFIIGVTARPKRRKSSLI